MIATRLLASLSVMLAASVALAAPVLVASPDVPIDMPLKVSALGDQDDGALAFAPGSPGVYLAVWHEQDTSSLHSIRAAQVMADGTALDPPITLVGPIAGQLEQAAVAFDGTNFVVCWHDLSQQSIEVRLVSPAGMLGSASASIPNQPNGSAVVAAGGGTTVVAYRQTGTLGIYAAVVASDTLLGPTLTVSSDPLAIAPAIALGSSGFLVTWTTQVTQPSTAGAWSSLITAGTTPSASAPLELTPLAPPMPYPTPADISVAWSGTEFLAVWSQVNAGGDREIRGRAVSPTGTVGLGDFLISATLHRYFYRPQVAFINGDYLVAWEDTDVLKVTAVIDAVRSTSLAPIDALPVVLQAGAALPTPLLSSINPDRPVELASAGTTGRLAVQHRTLGITGHDFLTLAIGSGAPAASAAAPTSVGPNIERSPQVAWNGSVFLAVWEDDRNVDLSATRGTDLYGQRFDSKGMPLGAPFVLMGQPGDQRYPAVGALPGGDFLVAWEDTRRDAAATTISTADYNVAVSDFSFEARLFIARVKPDGTVREPLGTAMGLAAGSSGGNIIYKNRFPQVAVDPINQRWLVSWDFETLGTGASVGVATAVVKDDGSLLTGADAKQVHVVSLPSTPALCGGNAVFAGGQYVLVLESGCASRINAPPANSDVVAIPVAADGVPDGTNPISVAVQSMFYEMAPSVAVNSAGAVVGVWEEHAPKTGGNGTPVPATAGTLRGALLGGTGAPQSFDVASGGNLAPRWPNVVSTGAGFLVSFLDETIPTMYGLRGLRLQANGQPNPNDAKPGAATTLASFGDSPVVQPLAGNPDPNGGGLAAGADGQMLLVYDTESPKGVGRARSRLLNGRSLGDACTPASAGFGCADGRCERDAEHDTAGLCCDTPCSGPCQKCTANGCVGVPPGDSLCGTISCAALNTVCRTYKPAPTACGGFNLCGSSDDLSTCTAFDAANDGGACDAPGCSKMGACQGGACVCGDASRDVGGPRVVPAGCSIGGSGESGGAWALALGLLALYFVRRKALRRSA